MLRFFLEVMKKYQLNLETVHLDSSSFHADGEYKNFGENKTIKITYSYSREHRPDVKQFLMELICIGDGDVPLWMKICGGE